MAPTRINHSGGSAGADAAWAREGTATAGVGGGGAVGWLLCLQE